MKKIRKLLVVLLLIGISISTGAQEYVPNGIQKTVDKYVAAGDRFEKVNILNAMDAGRPIPNLHKHLLFKYSRDAFWQLYNSGQNGIQVPIIINGVQKELKLVKTTAIAERLDLSTSSGKDKQVPVINMEKSDLGLHFVGYVIGEESKSKVSLSMYKDNMYGMISSPSVGNIFMLKLDPSKNDDIMAAYDPSDLIEPKSRTGSCETKIDPDIFSSEKMDYLPGTNSKTTNDVFDNGTELSSGKCVTYFLEMNDNIYNAFGGNLTLTFQYGMAIFSQSATIFMYEEILLKLEHINVWISTSPYDSWNSIPHKKGEFVDQWENNFSQDVGMAIDFGWFGSTVGIAFINSPWSFCQNQGWRMGYSTSGWAVNQGQDAGFNLLLPQYHDLVVTLTHETGHVFGSPHTHACFWNGNGTVIDGCDPSEGLCSNGTPVNPGTIMSYCPVAINLGFGPQPGLVMRNLLSVQPCLSSCDIDCRYSYSLYNNNVSSNDPFVFRVSNWIYSSASYNLSGSDYLEYDAGHYIDLVPGVNLTAGFHAQVSYGASFLAHINGCSSPQKPLAESDKTLYHSILSYMSNYSEKDKGNSPMGSEYALKRIQVYPNPNTGSFTIHLSRPGNCAIKVMNLLGSIVYETEMISEAKKEVILDAGLPPGNYTIHINGDNIRHIEKLTIVK